MRSRILLLSLFLAVGSQACRQTTVGSPSGAAKFTTYSFGASPKKPDFETQVKPIFVARCQPCHFQGGQVYDAMPFDKPETITRLGEKLFTRLKDEKDQRLVREFLALP